MDHGISAKLTYRSYRSNLRRPPCGPPPAITCSLDSAPLNLKHVLLSDRYKMMSFHAKAGMLISEKIEIIVFWSMRLNALLESTSSGRASGQHQGQY